MLLNTRDTIASVPAVEVPSWVSIDDIAIKLNCFLTTLIVYDAGEYTVRIRHPACLIIASVTTFDREVRG